MSRTTHHRNKSRQRACDSLGSKRVASHWHIYNSAIGKRLSIAKERAENKDALVKIRNDPRETC